jgi:hypothetical protein
MPYISQELRTPYIPLIEKTVKLICEDSDFRRAENFGYFTDNLFAAFRGQEYRMGDDYGNTDYIFVDNDKILSLSTLSNLFSTHFLKDNDLFNQAAEINYCISSVLWGILGDSLHSGRPAKYGFRCYVKGLLLRIYGRLNQHSSDRRTIIQQGIISDVIEEMYRRKTASYQDLKIIQNGDIWPLRSISFIEKPSFEVRQKDEDFD